MKNVVQFLWSKPAPRDWSNQDLADFYRVEAALVQAGLSVETDRGLSDEGEPWFVFCHADTQDVIVHCARIDGMYVVASAAFEGILRGTDFRDVVEGVLSRHPLVMPRQKEGSNVHFHPSALLVALIATAFFKLSGEAQASDGVPEVSIATSSSRLDFSALKHLLIDLDKRQAALVVAAMVYIHTDMGMSTLNDQGIAKADIASETSSSTEMASVDQVDQLFQQFMTERAQSDTAQVDHPQAIQITSDPGLTTWNLAVAEHNDIADGASTRVAGEQAVPLVQEGQSLPSVVVLATLKVETDASFLVIVSENRERAASSAITTSSTADGSQSVAAVQTHKVLQALISDFSTGSLGTTLSEISKEQVVAALSSATTAVATAPSVSAEVQAVVSSSPDLLKGTVLEEIKSFYDPKQLSETIVAAKGSIDTMVKDFVLNTLDFHSITSGRNIIFYDPTPTGRNDEKFVTIVFDDQSTLSLIGTFDAPHLTV